MHHAGIDDIPIDELRRQLILGSFWKEGREGGRKEGRKGRREGEKEGEESFKGSEGQIPVLPF